MRNFSIEILDSQGEYFISFCAPVLQRAVLSGDERKAADVLNDNYQHGGGWDPFPGFQTVGDAFDPAVPDSYRIKYPGDPTLRPHALIRFGKETVAFYDHELVAVWQPNGQFEICRMD